MRSGRTIRAAGLAAALVTTAGTAAAQAVPDTTFRPSVPAPAWPGGDGPVVAVDEGHHNYHTAGGRYAPFVRLLRADGFRVQAHAGPVTGESLAGVGILVVANALHESNAERWSLPTPPAFTPEEVALVREWVRGGRSLWLIADHMPFPGAAESLAAAFGFTLRNGFAFAPDDESNFTFRASDGSLAPHEITAGLDSVTSFTGQALRGPAGAAPLLVLGPGVVSLEPEEAWQFDSATPRVPVGGWWQGGVLVHGRGRVAVFGEAAMFSAQVAGPSRMPAGFNHPRAAQNARLALAVARWLGARE